MSELKKIVLQIGEKEIELTPDEAKELKKVLGDLFGEDKTVFVPNPYPVYPYYRPYFTWGTHTSPNDNGVAYITSGSVTSAASTTGATI